MGNQQSSQSSSIYTADTKSQLISAGISITSSCCCFIMIIIIIIVSKKLNN